VKIAHFADTHLGFKRFTKHTRTGINQREADVGAASRRTVNAIVEAKPDLVIHAGDIFHSPRPNPNAIIHAVKDFTILSTLGVPILAIGGNHDQPRTAETGSILPLLADIPNVHMAIWESVELRLEELELTALLYPHASLASGSPIQLEQSSRFQILIAHGDVAGLYGHQEAGGAQMADEKLTYGWDYVALGHYHTCREVAPNAWYSGSTEFVSPNPWGEILDEIEIGTWQGCKWWLEVNIGDGRPCASIIPRPIKLSRQHIDLQPIDANGIGPSRLMDRLREHVGGLPDGPSSIEGQVVRQIVRNVSRETIAGLDHERIRQWKAKALNFNLDLRKPEKREVVARSAGPSKTVNQTVIEYLEGLPPIDGIENSELVDLANRKFEEIAAEEE